MTGADIASAPKIRRLQSDSLIVDVLSDLNKVVAAVCPPNCDACEIYWDFTYHGEASDTWPRGMVACFVSEGNESPIVNLGVLTREPYGAPLVFRGLGAVKPMGAEERPYAHRICQAVTDAICNAEY